MGAVTVPVLLDDWQIECCGEAPGVGDRVSWWLDWDAGYAELLPSDLALTARVERLPASVLPRQERRPKTVPALAWTGDLTVFVLVPPRGPDELLLRGVLHEEHHGGVPADVPKTAGVVRRVRLVSWDYRQVGDRTWERVAGSAQLEEVRRAPTPSAAPEDPARPAPANVLVDLAV